MEIYLTIKRILMDGAERMNRGAVWGLGFGLVFSVFSTMLLMFSLGGIGSGAGFPFFLFGEGWMYFATVIPHALAFLFAGQYVYKQKKVNRKTLWKISALLGFAVTLLSATFGTVLGESIVRGGLETVNDKDTIVWGTIYSFVFLPITIPLARFVLQLFIVLLLDRKVVEWSVFD